MYLDINKSFNLKIKTKDFLFLESLLQRHDVHYTWHYKNICRKTSYVTTMRAVCTTSMWPGSQGEWTMKTSLFQSVGEVNASSDHVDCVAIAFKMTEWVEQQICIRFCVKLEHSSVKTIQMIQKATAMGNWWLAASWWQYTHSCITSHAALFGKMSNHPSDSAPLQSRCDALRLLAFPQTKVTFEREEISDPRWDSGKYGGAADGDWENCVRSQGV